MIFKDNEKEGENESGNDRRIATSMDKEMRIYLKKDIISTFYLGLERIECYDPITTYTVYIPVKEQNTPKVNELKEKEIDNFIKYDMLKEVKDNGQEKIGSRWV